MNEWLILHVHRTNAQCMIRAEVLERVQKRAITLGVTVTIYRANPYRDGWYLKGTEVWTN
jgi:hypothetical protein